MGLDNSIEYAISNVLKNPILQALREIKISKILKQSNFIKRNIGYSPLQVLLHFVYMLVMNKRQSTFIRHSDNAYKKDTYYRFVQNVRYNWRKLLILSASAFIEKIRPLQRCCDDRVLIIDDTVEPKRGKQIEGSCRKIYSNKEHRYISGINMVNLVYSDKYSTFQLDFALHQNKSRRHEIEDFTKTLHHKSNAYKRRKEGLESKNLLAIGMLERALENGIDADYLLVDSWYAKPQFLKDVKSLGLDTIARLPNNPRIWNFQEKYKTINALYNGLKSKKHTFTGYHGKIRYRYFDAIVHHKTLGKIKLVFLSTHKELLVFISTDITRTAEEIINIYKKRWNIEQSYKDLREYFGFGKEENRIYEAMIARITLSMFTYNLITYINRISHEPKTLGELFRDLECELETLVISMQLFLQILTNIANIHQNLKTSKELHRMIAIIEAYTKKELGFMCES